MGRIADISEVLLDLGLSAACTETERALAQTALWRAESAVITHLGYNPAQAVRTEFYPTTDVRTSAGNSSAWEVNEAHAYQVSRYGSRLLRLRHLPIRRQNAAGNAIDLRIDTNGKFGTAASAFGAATQKTEGIDFWGTYASLDDEGYGVCKDGLLNSHSVWPVEAGSVKIIYLCGYTPAELHGQSDTIDAMPIVETVVMEAVSRVHKAASRMKKANVGFAGPFTSENLGDYSYSVDASITKELIGTGSELLAESMSRLESFVNYGWKLV